MKIAMVVLWAILLGAGAGMLFGCTTPMPLEPRVETKTVEVQVPSHCAKDAPAPGVYADADLGTTTDPVERLKKLGAANQERKARLAVIEPVITGCR